MLKVCLLIPGVMMAANTMVAAEPLMLPREVSYDTVLVRDGRPEAVIVAPAQGEWRRAAEQVADGIARLTGARLTVLAPEQVTQKDGLRLTDEFRRRPVVFIGNVGVNAALFEPYVRCWFVVDEENLGPDAPEWAASYSVRPHRPRPEGWTVETFPDAWGTGAGYALAGASREADIARAAEAFLAVCEKHAQGNSLILPRVCEPGPDDLVAAANPWRRLARPAKQDWLAKFKESRAMHLGYNIGRELHLYTLIAHSGAFNAEEMNDVEQELLENILMFPQKVWWYQGGKRNVGDRHLLFKNTRLYLAVEHLLTVGQPNQKARARLQKMHQDLADYLHYGVTRAYYPDIDPNTETHNAWQSASWMALVRGDWEHFTEGRAREAALFALLSTDNLGGSAGQFPYQDVAELHARSGIRNVLRAAAWWYRDGRFKWVLENLPLAHTYAYGFPITLPLSGIEAREPHEWLGVQWLPLSDHSYEESLRAGKWTQPGIPREKSVSLLSLRSGFGANDQYLALDGFQNEGFQPLGLGAVVRYVDLGKLFLVAHTGKDGNYYKPGLAVSAGTLNGGEPSRVTDAMREGAAGGQLAQQVIERDEPWGAEVVAGANLPRVGLVALRARNYHGTDWTRHIIWRKGHYFVFMDEARALTPGEFMLTATWRTGAPAALAGQNWVQRQGDVSFFLKPAHAMTARAGQAPDEEYQNEVVPYLLRQSLPLHAQRAGDGECLQNLVYASSPARPGQYDIARVGPGCALVRGTDELALVGFGAATEAGVTTDAGHFYLSPERVAVAGGTELALAGTSLLSQRKAGNFERPVPAGQRDAVRRHLEGLWATGALEERGRFAEFRAHPRRILPLEERRGTGEWWVDLGRAQEIAGVVVALREKAEGLELAFSDDDFGADVRPVGEGRASSRITGPVGKSYFPVQLLHTFAGARARYLRVRLSKGGPVQDVEILSSEQEPAAIVELKACDLDANDGRRELLCRTRDNQLALLAEDGKLLWKRDFEHNVLSTAALDLEETGRKEVLVVDASSTLWRFSPDGALKEQAILKTADNTNADFFRFNRAYCLGAWKPLADEKPSLIMGMYQSIAWRKPDGRIVGYPEVSDELPYRSGYVWRGLVYWERTLERGLDLNGDGVEDQVFLSRGFAVGPTLMFFDGAKRDAFAEFTFPNGRTLGLEVVNLGGERRVLAANEFKLMLCSLQGQEVCSVRFDTPAAAYAVAGDTIVVAKRDGLLLLLDAQGRVIRKRLLAPELRAVAADGETILVAGDEGVFHLDHQLNGTRRLPLQVRALVALGAGRFAAATDDGNVVGL